MSIWKNQSSNHLKPWGNESRFGSPFGIAGKVITIREGHRTSLKFYKAKNQLMYCLEGKIKVFAPEEAEFGDIRSDEGNYFILAPGNSLLIQCQNSYRMQALEDSKIIEVIVGANDNDQGLVMLDDDYGRNFEKSKISE